MRQPEQPPVPRTTAQLIIIVGSMILFFGLVLLTIFLALGDPNVTSARGVPLWLSTSVVLFIGSAVITTGVVVYPRGRSGTPPT